MKLSKAISRDSKRNKRNKMQVDSRSVFTIEEEKKKRADYIKKQRKLKEESKGLK